MGDFAQGIKAFKKGMSEDDKTAEAKPEPVKSIDHAAATTDAKPSGKPSACAPDARVCARTAARRRQCATRPATWS